MSDPHCHPSLYDVNYIFSFKISILKVTWIMGTISLTNHGYWVGFHFNKTWIKGVFFAMDKGMILNLLTADKLGSFIRSDIPGGHSFVKMGVFCRGRRGPSRPSTPHLWA